MNHLFYCHNCKHEFTQEIKDTDLKTFRIKKDMYEGIKCEKCKKLTAENVRVLINLGIVTGKSFTVTAIKEDDKGNQVEVNHKGKILNNRKYKNDPRGYKFAGKKVREFDQYGKHNSQW